MTELIPKSDLFQCARPRLLIEQLQAETPELVPQSRFTHERMTMVVRVLRGRKMHSKSELMNEVSAALQFYGVFGENWHALKDCLYDLDECRPAEGFIIVVTEPMQVLIDQPEELQWFIKVFDEIGDWWAQPVVGNPPFDRDAMPFHLIFEADKDGQDELLNRIESAVPGVTVGILVDD